MRSWWLSLALIGVHCGAGARSDAPAPVVTPDTEAVLVAGLPGDLESETSYRTLLLDWLETLAKAGVRAHRTHVLWDQPAGLKDLAAGVEVRPASRAEFLALSARLATNAAPLFVVLWGHGGVQGETPVFHVRGPRLTPEDFRAFAAQARRAEAAWLLWFRSSGAFARELTVAHARVLSSANERIHGNDPVGLPLVQKLLAAQPGIALADLARETGVAVREWYASRSLVRTEEPTLWLPGEPPRPLAADAETVAEAPSPVPAETPAPVTAARTPKLPATASAAWNDLRPVDPAAFPNADAVVLRRRINHVLANGPHLTTEREEFIQILRPEGKHHGDFDLAYTPPEEEISFPDCEVLDGEGQLIRLDPDDIREHDTGAPGNYGATRRKFFSLPGLRPGAIFRVRVRLEWKQYPLPHFCLEIPLADPLPVLDLTVQITAAKDATFHFAFDQMAPREPLLEETAYGRARTWRWQQLEAHAPEALAPPRRLPSLLVSTFPDWAAFADWYASLSSKADEITPELLTTAKALTRDAPTDRARVAALYEYVTALRYVAVPLGVNSHRPHAAANVLKNQFGDCKDKANLLNTLARALGLEASLVLVPRFDQAHPAVPGLAFNHALSRVRLGTERMWLDTTDDLCRFGMLPPGDAGRAVLVIDGQSTNLTELPWPAADDHQLTLKARVEALASEPSAPTRLEVTARGFPDYALRQVARGFRRDQATVALLAAVLEPSAGVFQLASQEFSPVSMLTNDFTWRAQGRSLGLVSPLTGGFALRAPFWLPVEWAVALNRRTAALNLNQGYPLRLLEQIDLVLPVGAREVKLPADAANLEAPLRWQVQWRQTGAGPLEARLDLTLERGELSPAETPRLQRQLGELLTKLAAVATFSALP